MRRGSFREKNEALNEEIHQIVRAGDRMPEGSWTVSKAEQMKATSAGLSQEMIYTKFLQDNCDRHRGRHF